jgi:hypothetical protein
MLADEAAKGWSRELSAYIAETETYLFTTLARETRGHIRGRLQAIVGQNSPTVPCASPIAGGSRRN